MSRGRSAFNLVGASNLPSGIFQLRQSEVSDAVSLSSSKQSSIPELSKAEELALKRTSSEFAPIGQRPSADLMQSLDRASGPRRTNEWGEGESETRMGDKNADDLMHSWRPSADLMQSLDRASGPRRTNEWDDDELEVSQQSSNPPVDIIPSHVRGSTPDSVVSSGRFVIGGSHGERKPLDAGHLQENVVHKTNYNLHKSMRAQLSELDDARPSTSTADIEVEMRRSRSTDERAGQFDPFAFQIKPEEKRSFWPRCSLLLLAVMIALAAVIALVVRFKDNTNVSGMRGKVLPDNITHQECTSKVFNLGDELNFTCIFDANHAYRNRIEESVRVDVIPKSRISTDIYYTMEVIVGTNGTSRHEIFVKGDSMAKCSSAGTYDVIFRDSNGRDTAIVNVTFTMKESTLVTSMNQRQLKGSNCLETMFDITCNIHNDCNNYHTTIYKNKFGNVQNLNSYLECKRNFTDDDGYMIDCSGSLPDNLVESYSFLACKMEAKRPDNKVVKKEQRYTLPNCGVETSCHTRVPGNNFLLFNCSEKAADYLNLQTAVCYFPKQRNCLKSGRKVFSLNKDRFDNLTCSTENTVPVCRLSWCSDYRFIRKNEIPGVVICSPSFNEWYVSPTTTSTTVRTSEGTSPTT